MFVCQSLELLGQAPVSQAAQINLFQAIVIGIVQGLTEFLPISSTAHVKIIPVALGWGDPGVAFTAVIQLGSLAAILWYFWDDLTSVTRNTITAAMAKRYQSSDFRLGLGILLGSIPIVFCGLLIKVFFETQYETSVIRSTQAIAITSIVMAILLGVAEKVGTRKRNFEKLDLWDGIGVGLGQALALVPGVSRSGSTLTAGLFLGLERDTAARFSFLLGTPAILISGLVELKGLLEDMSAVGNASLMPLIGGLIAAVISSYLAIAWLIKFLRRHSTWVFVWYRLAFGVAILIGIATKTIQNV
ncbi:undecaprenyl-diphosphate phosphatase [Leptolyngbya cf. ectocarpi LEGE 11479]|uniref:Undecaprenyl-diphosphatase n=1 Tax=Leptolyngbya cf. ectocarpi LEGE 11479 TaxID=1828722 RepID=A0A928WYS5_LEPEC|nr:undecaprenyl-diphosphate phosphatase [Leptolyngbya ectocarpi]MBE9065327.1 undecaprenyl-diphosphate phosphatase [Leptolyngbya cf. ectocarpi LEGE 11479]